MGLSEGGSLFLASGRLLFLILHFPQGVTLHLSPFLFLFCIVSSFIFQQLALQNLTLDILLAGIVGHYLYIYMYEFIDKPI